MVSNHGQKFYHAYFKTDLTQPDAVVFETEAGNFFRFGPTAMAYYDASSKNYHIISRAKKPRKPEVEGNTITYSNILPGVDVRLSYQATRLKEEILLTPKARENLPDPSTLGMKGGDVYLVFLTQFSADTSLVAYADQRKISERGRGRGGAGELMFDFEGEERKEPRW